LLDLVPVLFFPTFRSLHLKRFTFINIAKLGQTSQIWSAQSYMVIMEIVKTTYPIRTN
jgi:hypothetical protein